MRPTLLLSSAALLILSGCIEEPKRVVPVGGMADDHGVDHGSMDHGDVDHGNTLAEVVAGMATVQVAPLGGSDVTGSVTFTQMDDGQLQVAYNLRGLEPGAHGFHVHENGSCADGADGTPGGAAGGHFNPGDAPHGGPEAAASARHAGDWGNIEATASGMASGTFTDDVASLTGERGISGKALMIHSGRDDLQSQPSGAAGDRVGCGVIGSVEQVAQ